MDNQDLQSGSRHEDESTLIRLSFDELFKRVRMLVDRLNEAAEENASLRKDNQELKEKINLLNLEISNLNLYVSRLDSGLVAKESELENYKELLDVAQQNSITLGDREEVKDKIKDMIGRIDNHLLSFENGKADNDKSSKDVLDQFEF